MSTIYTILFALALVFSLAKIPKQYEVEDEDTTPPVAEQVYIVNTREDKGDKWDDDPLDKDREGLDGSDKKR